MAPQAPETAETATSTTQDETSDKQELESTDETSGQDQQNDKQSPPEAKPEETKPDPRLKTLRADLNKKQQEFISASSERDALKAEVAKLTPVQETLDAVQTRYDRLESFLQAVGGPLGKALDSKSFTTQLFESDKDINDIVKDWNRANPTATASALGSGGAAPAAKAPGINDLLRAAVK
jgi:hypothetical protein